MSELAASAIPTGLAAGAQGIPMPYLNVLFSLYFYSAAHPRHDMSVFAPLLGHGECRAPGSITDSMHDPMMSASRVALRCDVTWLSHLRRFAPRRAALPSRLTLRELRPTRRAANRLGSAQADLRSVKCLPIP
jgi:hypothetical protein